MSELNDLLTTRELQRWSRSGSRPYSHSSAWSICRALSSSPQSVVSAASPRINRQRCSSR
ncbi:hypothetical protein IBK38_20950, partial [Escherichia coli]|nr:hypothetical protein [Escherichia coli]